jgi:hypothetical protein
MVDINLRVIYRPEPSSLPQMYRTLGLDYDERHVAPPRFLSSNASPPCPSLARHLAVSHPLSGAKHLDLMLSMPPCALHMPSPSCTLADRRPETFPAAAGFSLRL